jgi:hypothetical protein
MRDSQPTKITLDGFSTVLFLLLAIVAAAGFSSAGAVIGSKDEAIALLKQQLENSQIGLNQCEAEFSGFAKGRH